MGYRFSSLSTQAVRYDVVGYRAGALVNPTGDTVEFAFTTGAPPTSWTAGAWETIPGPPVRYVARCLIGPAGDVNLTPGDWVVWIRVTDVVEVPVAAIGNVTIT